MTRFLFHSVILLLTVWLEPANAKNFVYHYEPETIELTGTIGQQTFPGRPGYESIESGDEIETGWYFKLDRPIDVNNFKGEGGHEETPEKNVKVLQLTSYADDIIASMPKLDGKKVTLKGQLFHAFSGHHHARVLMRIIAIGRVDK